MFLPWNMPGRDDREIQVGSSEYQDVICKIQEIGINLDDRLEKLFITSK